MEPEREEKAAADLRSTAEQFVVDLHRLYPKKIFRPEDLRTHLTVTGLRTIAEMQRRLVDLGEIEYVHDDGDLFIETRSAAKS